MRWMCKDHLNGEGKSHTRLLREIVEMRKASVWGEWWRMTLPTKTCSETSYMLLSLCVMAQQKRWPIKHTCLRRRILPFKPYIIDMLGNSSPISSWQCVISAARLQHVWLIRRSQWFYSMHFTRRDKKEVAKQARRSQGRDQQKECVKGVNALCFIVGMRVMHYLSSFLSQVYSLQWITPHQ